MFSYSSVLLQWSRTFHEYPVKVQTCVYIYHALNSHFFVTAHVKNFRIMTIIIHVFPGYGMETIKNFHRCIYGF